MTTPAAAEGWHLDDHQITITLDRSGHIQLTAECTVDRREATADDPCCVDYDEDGEAIAGNVLRYCNFTAWLDLDAADLIERLHPKAAPWPVSTCPLDIAVRWKGGGYEWAPREWVLTQQFRTDANPAAPR